MFKQYTDYINENLILYYMPDFVIIMISNTMVMY